MAESIKEEATCNVCCYVRLPIYQCPNGHLHCGVCHEDPKFNRGECPECRLRIGRSNGTWTINRALGRLVTMHNLEEAHEKPDTGGATALVSATAAPAAAAAPPAAPAEAAINATAATTQSSSSFVANVAPAAAPDRVVESRRRKLLAEPAQQAPKKKATRRSVRATATMVGRRVHQQFIGFGKHFGTVIAQVGDGEAWVVNYDDGDQRTLSELELQKWLVPLAACEVDETSAGTVAPSATNAASTDETATERKGSRQWFHVNTFINKIEQTNQGFGPFLRTCEVTIGWAAVYNEGGLPMEQLVKKGKGDYHILRKEIVAWHSTLERLNENVNSTATQLAMWLTQVRKGDIVVMRHTYEMCPFIPEKLKTLANGVYKPVYAIVRVVTPPTITSRKSLCDPRQACVYLQAPCATVEPIGLGFWDHLSESTQKYLGGNIQATIARFKTVDNGGKFTKAHENDLWQKATIRIDPSDWPYYVHNMHP